MIWPSLRITVLVFLAPQSIPALIIVPNPFFRPHVSQVIYRFLDCGILHNGFAPVKCGECGPEYLSAFSCKRRYFCPSWHQKQGVEFGDKWRHSGFNVLCGPRIQPGDEAALENLARYATHAPFSQKSPSWCDDIGSLRMKTCPPPKCLSSEFDVLSVWARG